MKYILKENPSKEWVVQCTGVTELWVGYYDKF